MNKKNLPHIMVVAILVIAMAAWLYGCLSTAEEVFRPSITVSPPTQVSATPTPENTATATILPTRKPTATRPPTRTPLPRQTDLPSIEPGGINAMIDSLYSRCELPCWGSIIPGKTSQYAAKRFLSPLGEWYNPVSPSGEWSSSGSVSIQYNNATAYIGLTFEHGLVSSVQLHPTLTRQYRITRLFTEYGMPEDVRIEVLPLTAVLTTWFNLVVVYPRQGFFAIYSANGTPINSIIHVCPRNVSPDLYLFASNAYSLDQMNETLSVIRPHTDFESLDTVAEIDVNQFYDIFLGQSVNCVATKFEFQLPP
jgi:hypothetical protein